MSAVLQASLTQQVVAVGGVRTVRVLLAGCGTVGGALIRLLREQSAAIEQEHGVRFDVVGVLVRDVRRPRIVERAAGVVTSDVAAWLATDADIVIEATGAVDTAYGIARVALASGRRFVTANKALLSAHGAELAALAHAHGGRLDFEAAVGGGVPIIRVLRDALRHTGVRGVRAVLNGTSNYVLSRLAEGESIEQALHEARLKGFAEADASRDLDGRDAADKIAVLAWLAFGIDPAAVDVQRRGLLPDAAALVTLARAHGGVLRQVAECFETDEGVSAVVEPVIVGCASPLAHVAGEENAVVVETRRNGVARLFGAGAGGMPTAAALLGDMLRDEPRQLPPRVSSARSIADTRLHEWAIVLHSEDAQPLLRACDAADVRLRRVRVERSAGQVHALTGPVSRSAIADCIEQLNGNGAGASAVRVQTSE